MITFDRSDQKCFSSILSLSFFCTQVNFNDNQGPGVRGQAPLTCNGGKKSYNSTSIHGKQKT